MDNRWVVGVDEVGRGPLAGPVTVCAFAIPLSACWFKNVEKLPLRDSKKLSEIQRLHWLSEIRLARKRGDAFFVVRSISARKIDHINISRAANLAATLAFRRVIELLPKNARVRYPVVLDGGLKIGGSIPVQQISLAKADERFPVVSLASITAKVHRDQRMSAHAKQYPRYGFEENAGYGTEAHIRAIRKYGLCREHRRSFTKGITSQR